MPQPPVDDWAAPEREHFAVAREQVALKRRIDNTSVSSTNVKACVISVQTSASCVLRMTYPSTFVASTATGTNRVRLGSSLTVPLSE